MVLHSKSDAVLKSYTLFFLYYIYHYFNIHYLLHAETWNAVDLSFMDESFWLLPRKTRNNGNITQYI